MIHDELGLPPAQQCLMFAGEELRQEAKSLALPDIKTDSGLILLLRLGQSECSVLGVQPTSHVLGGRSRCVNMGGRGR